MNETCYCWKCGKKISTTDVKCPFCDEAQIRMEVSPHCDGKQISPDWQGGIREIHSAGYCRNCEKKILTTDIICPFCGGKQISQDWQGGIREIHPAGRTGRDMAKK